MALVQEPPEHLVVHIKMFGLWYCGAQFKGQWPTAWNYRPGAQTFLPGTVLAVHRVSDFLLGSEPLGWFRIA